MSLFTHHTEWRNVLFFFCGCWLKTGLLNVRDVCTFSHHNCNSLSLDFAKIEDAVYQKLQVKCLFFYMLYWCRVILCHLNYSFIHSPVHSVAFRFVFMARKQTSIGWNSLPPWNSRRGLENVIATSVDIGLSRKWVKLQFWLNCPFKFSVFALWLPVRFYLSRPPSFSPSHRCLIRPFPCCPCLLFFGFAAVLFTSPALRCSRETEKNWSVAAGMACCSSCRTRYDYGSPSPAAW